MAKKKTDEQTFDVSEFVDKLETTKLIECYFEDFKYLINAMEFFMSRYPDELNGFNIFEDQFSRVAFVITIDALHNRFETNLLNNSTEHNEKLFNITTIKIQDIEKRLFDNKFITLYNKFKTVRIDFKKSYVKNMVYTPPFFKLVGALTLYNDDPPKGIRYGTLETFYNATLDLFNDAKSRINNLFSLKKLSIIASTQPQPAPPQKETEPIKWNNDVKQLAYLFWKLKKENIIENKNLGMTLSKLFIDKNVKEIKNTIFNKHFSDFEKNNTFPDKAKEIDTCINSIKEFYKKV